MAKEKISIFGKKPIAATPKKTDKTIVNVDGLEEKLLEFDFMKSQMEDLKAQLDAVTDEIKNISKEKFIELYTNKRTNPNTFLIKDGEGCVMVIPQDRYKKIDEDSERAEYLKSQYGDDAVTEDIKYVFNNEVLERNMKAIESLIVNAKNISDYDKKNLITPIIKYSVAKGFIDKLYEYEDMEKVLDDIQPTIALKNCGGKMELGGETDYNDFITNIYDEEDKFEYGGETDSDFIANIYEDGGTTCGCSHKEGGELFNPFLKPLTYKVFDENEIVLKTQSFNKAVDYRTLNGKHLKIVAIDKNGNSKVIASVDTDIRYANGGGVGKSETYAKGSNIDKIEAYQTKTGRYKKDDFGKMLFNMPDGKQRYYFSRDDAKIDWIKSKNYSKDDFKKGDKVVLKYDLDYHYGNEEILVVVGFDKNYTDDWKLILEGEKKSKTQRRSYVYPKDVVFYSDISRKYANGGGVQKNRGIIEEFNHKGWNVKHFVDKSYDDDYWYFVFNSTPFEFDTKEKAIKELDSLIKNYKYEDGGQIEDETKSILLNKLKKINVDLRNESYPYYRDEQLTKIAKEYGYKKNKNLANSLGNLMYFDLQEYLLSKEGGNTYREGAKDFLEYADGGITGQELIIPKQELEFMVGRKLNGWNDEKIEYNGKVYEKCFLKPYYKIIN